MPVIFGRPIPWTTATSVVGAVGAMVAFLANSTTVIQWVVKPKTADAPSVITLVNVHPAGESVGRVSQQPQRAKEPVAGEPSTGGAPATPVVAQGSEPTDRAATAPTKMTLALTALSQEPYRPAQEAPAKLELPNEAKQ